MSRRARAGRLPLNADINVVSLIDVMMLLMVIFMITAPMMQGGVDIALPQAQARPLEAKNGLVVTIDRGGNILVDENKLRYEEFRASFKALARNSSYRSLFSSTRMLPPRSIVTTSPFLASSGRACAWGSAMSTPPCIIGAVIMKITMSSIMTSMRLTTLMSA